MEIENLQKQPETNVAPVPVSSDETSGKNGLKIWSIVVMIMSIPLGIVGLIMTAMSQGGAGGDEEVSWWAYIPVLLPLGLFCMGISALGMAGTKPDIARKILHVSTIVIIAIILLPALIEPLLSIFY